jgi:hypothetical protein
MNRIVKGEKGTVKSRERDILRRLNRLNRLDIAEPGAYLAVAFPRWDQDPVGSTEKVPATCRCHYARQAEHLAQLIEEGGTPAALVWTVPGGTGLVVDVLPWALGKEGYVASIVEAFSAEWPRPSSAAIQ